MGRVIPERMCAQIDGDFVVFIIGLRINKPWKIHKWLPVFLAMPRMLKELEKKPEAGLLGVQSAGLTLIQYWRSFDALEQYARSTDSQHWPAWVAFNKRMGRSRGDVGRFDCEAVFEIGVHRYRDAGGDGAQVVEDFIERHVVVAAADGPGEAGARRGDCFEAQAGQQPCAADVERVWDDETA